MSDQTTTTPLKGYVNLDGGYKLPLAGGDKAPKGPFTDFRAGVKKELVGFGEKAGSLYLDIGTWTHLPLSEIVKSKERWWMGLTYFNPAWLNFSASARGYGGFGKASSMYGMVAAAVAVGIQPKIVGPLSFNLNYFGVLHEEYYGAPIDSAQFHLGTFAPTIDLGNFSLALPVQAWHIIQKKAGADIPATTHIQFTVSSTYKF